MRDTRGSPRRPGCDGPDHPVRVGLIGAGKFGTMFLAQARRIPGLHVLGVADLSIDRARDAPARAEWPPSQFAATDFENSLKSGGTHVTDDADSLVFAGGLDVLVEADVLAGPVLAQRALS